MPRKKSLERSQKITGKAQSRKRNKRDEDSSTDSSLDTRDVSLENVLRDLPEDMVKNLPTVLSRLNAFIAYFSVLNLSRLSKLTSFVTKAEEVLFDDSTILNLDSDTLKDNYKQAKTATLEILDLARKVAIQIPQEDSSDKNVDEVYRLLKSLSPDAVEEIKENLQRIQSNDDN
jgi:hypothetical protein